ncbi:hypothetical protein M406DRAFT_289501 [Cryphonectria parasitica EP155]|uniref:LysR family regulatory protein n=1 Tax=Cryphonectria parasitica (strain ATCC 38755 / EP155) TaxID=660469 RepID=A0A9P4Y1J4_CRYP1|nr:uncharacterized protein M406DRAFT_289501 [Cryphonectria parasitica EP155]KAF3765309.1 hypothetical protein M406DRAFT_289501 [Cryphonectria parasitica EP155]
MWGLFGSKQPVLPATIPTDEIIPLSPLDDIDYLRSVCLVVTHRYDDVLDPEKLRYALERLVDLPGWRKMGARLRLNKLGKLEYHVPERYDEKRPGIGYSHVSYDISINEHPLASRIPRATEKPTVAADPNEFLDLARSEDGPRFFEDYITRDVPQLALHIVSFTDATLASLSFPHTFTDGTGGGHIYRAWSLALQERYDEIAEFHGYNHDPLAGFGANPTEPYIYADKLLTGWRKWLFLLRQLYLSVRYGTESRVLCMPGPYLTRLRKQAIEEIRAETGDPNAFVSDNDVLTAWFTQVAMSDMPRNSNRTIRIMTAFRLLGVVPNKYLPDGKAYVANAVSEVWTFLKARDIFNKPLSYTAHAIRRSLTEGGTPEQIEALAAIKREASEATGLILPTIFGDVTMNMINFTNNTKSKFFETDLSAAIVKEGLPRSTRTTPPGFPSYIQFNAWSPRFQLRDILPIMGRDAAGNYWLVGALRENVWSMIDKKLREA